MNDNPIGIECGIGFTDDNLYIIEGTETNLFEMTIISEDDRMYEKYVGKYILFRMWDLDQDRSEIIDVSKGKPEHFLYGHSWVIV